MILCSRYKSLFSHYTKNEIEYSTVRLLILESELPKRKETIMKNYREIVNELIKNLGWDSVKKLVPFPTEILLE